MNGGPGISIEIQLRKKFRGIREEHAARFNYDVDAIYADLKRLELESELPHVSLEPRRLSPRVVPGIIPVAASE